ncbi:hypothetical protein QBC33DRAFT_61766 [Phialemonium atrogriseum]|uniref:Uncharacterized protein n=1 Tax=Phialemonium atrogriseum TaxID=1093897 RepID=A0AAJ0FP78_9PEZI|nr:uncharacterized protein QBC33DRAFT_61766 [Phialemonium atrogriseum]KAK1767895.1 hypothetical protein QBC33DRAFT_61766 [Phialemonium atrogriseum]
MREVRECFAGKAGIQTTHDEDIPGMSQAFQTICMSRERAESSMMLAKSLVSLVSIQMGAETETKTGGFPVGEAIRYTPGQGANPRKKYPGEGFPGHLQAKVARKVWMMELKVIIISSRLILANAWRFGLNGTYSHLQIEMALNGRRLSIVTEIQEMVIFHSPRATTRRLRRRMGNNLLAQPGRQARCGTSALAASLWQSAACLVECRRSTSVFLHLRCEIVATPVLTQILGRAIIGD